MSVAFEMRNGNYLIVNSWLNSSGVHKKTWEIHKEDWIKIKKRIDDITNNRPKLDQFPKSKIEFKDNFDLMDKCIYQIEFFNEYYVSRNESKEIRRLILDAHDKFHGGQLAIFGSFPGFKLFGLMEDSGIHKINVY